MIIPVDKEEIEKLKNGDFSGAWMDFWFVNHAFDYIYAIIEGCDKNLDFYMLYFISIYAQNLIIEPNADKLSYEALKGKFTNTNFYPINVNEMTYEEMIAYWNGIIIRSCKNILQKVVEVGCRHSEVYYPILEQLINHPIDAVRLYLCGNGFYTSFLNDSSPRVKKVASICYAFEKKWQELSDIDSERQRIEFLTAALEKKAIQCINGLVVYEDDDKMSAKFTSFLFTSSGWQDGFDKDLIYTIQDKRILADALNQLIIQGKIFLRDGMVPSCFAEQKGGRELKNSE